MNYPNMQSRDTPLQVADLQVALKEEQIIVEEKKAATGALIESIGKEKAVADEAVEASRADEEAAAALSVSSKNLSVFSYIGKVFVIRQHLVMS